MGAHRLYKKKLKIYFSFFIKKRKTHLFLYEKIETRDHECDTDLNSNKKLMYKSTTTTKNSNQIINSIIIIKTATKNNKSL